MDIAFWSLLALMVAVWVRQHSLLRENQALRAALKALQERMRQESVDFMASEARWSAIFNHDPSCIKVLDGECRLLDMNPAGLSMLQADNLARIQGKFYYDWIDPAFRHAYQSMHERVMAGESQHLSYVIRQAGRNRLWLESEAVPLRDANGAVVASLSVTRNVTKRKSAEEALRESQEKLRGLYELSPLGIALTDMQGRFIEFNESFRHITGYAQEELYALDYWQLTPEKYRDQEAGQVESLLRTGRYGPYDKEYRRKDGTLVPLRLNGLLIQCRDGQSYIWSIVEDVTATKLAEDRLRLSHDELTHYFEQPFIGMLTANPSKGTVHVNQRFCDMLGYTKEEMQVTDWGKLTHPDDLAPNQALLDQAIRGEIDAYQMEKRYLHKDGHIVYVHLAVKCVRNYQGKPKYFIGMMMDITERKKLEARLADDAKISAALAELSQAMIKQATSIKEISDQTLATARKLTRSRHGFVSYIDPATGDNVSITLTEMIGQGCDVEGDGKRIAFPLGPDGLYPKLWGHVLNTRQGFFTNQPQQHQAAKGIPPRHVPLWAFLSVPALAGDCLLGQIALANPDGEYTAGDLAVAEQIAVIYAAALQRKRIEDALAENEQRFRAVFENAPIGIARVGLDKRILQINKEFCRIIGYAKEEILSGGFTIDQITLKDDLDQTHTHQQRLLEGLAESFTLEKRYRHKNGNAVWGIASVHLLRDGNHRPLYFIGAMQDITAQKRDEEQLRLAARVFESSGEAILVTDDQRQIVSVNPAFTKVTGYAFDEVRGKTPRLLKSGRHDAGFYQQLWQQLHEQGYWQGEIWNRRKNGELFPVWQIVSTVKSADGAVKNYVSLFIDITERHRIEQELISARDAANASAKAKSEFLANMSHEIRTPMNGILGLTQLALRQPVGPKVRDYLEKILGSSDGLLKILNDILDYSKIEAGYLPMEDNAFDLDDTLERLRSLLAYHAEEKLLGFSIEIADDVPRFLLGDELRLHQVLANLLGNAVKFTEHGGVRLSVSLQGKTQDSADLAFCVADTGIGMSAETLANLFRPFSQADASISRRFGGTGLGLAISQKILAMLGGEFKVSSVLGEGTEFSFTLRYPLAPSQLTAALPMANPPNTGLSGYAGEGKLQCFASLHILVAEDEPISQQVVSELLRSAGIRVSLAQNGLEALELLARQPFDAVLMDIHMPGMNGIAAVRELRKDNRYAALPVIAITAGVTEQERLDVRDSGMNGFIAKPVRAGELYLALRQWLPCGETTPQPITPFPNPARLDMPMKLQSLDFDDLVSALGNAELALHLLAQFHREVTDTMAKIEMNLAEGNLPMAEWLLHRIKGAASNIGTLAFAKACTVMDEELRNGQLNPDSLNELRSTYELMQNELSQLPAVQQCAAGGAVADKTDLADLSAEIDRLLEENYLVSNHLLERLKSVTPPDRLDLFKLLKGQIDSIEYPKARQTLQQLADN